jgi:hypothetical protein
MEITQVDLESIQDNEAGYSEQERHGFYKTLFNRRDVRGHFLPKKNS